MSSNSCTIQDEDGEYPDWIELFNGGDEAIDLRGFGLSDEPDRPYKWVFPSVNIRAHGRLLVFASGKDRTVISRRENNLPLVSFLTLKYTRPPDTPAGTPDSVNLHTNFKIDSEGETLVFTSPAGTLIDEVDSGSIPRDVSFGRLPDGGSTWVLFQNPTPGTANDDEGYEGIVDTPHSSRPGGFYTGGFDLSLIHDTPGVTIFYTTDGADPGESSMPYTGPIPVERTMVVRAKAFRTGWLPSKTITQTYFLDVETTLPVMSLSTDPAHLWNDETGIYVMGNTASPEAPYYGANFWEDWERPIHLEFYETGGTADLSLDAGVKITGGKSRQHPQKSLAIYARSVYGFGEMVYPFFPEKPVQTYEAIVLRNGGTDWLFTMLRDGFASNLVSPLGLDLQAYRPVVVFLNGEYWGVHNLREKINEHFIASNHNLDPDSIDLLQKKGVALNGDADHYKAMLDFIDTHDLSIQEQYDSVCTMMDVDNYILYQLSQIFIGNIDWPGNNIKYWRPKTVGGKWRWILYDTDCGFGLWYKYPYTFNTLEFAAEPNGPDWPNPPWSTFLFRSLLENETFRTDFIQTFCDHLNTTFQPERTIALLHEMRDAIAPEMPNHIEKWGVPDSWDSRVNTIETYASYRVEYVRSHLRSFFDLDTMALVHVDVSPDGGGTVQLNSLKLSEFPWENYYFTHLPLTISVQPATGFRFSGWSGLTPPDSPTALFEILEDVSITAYFEPVDDEDFPVINEINYNSSSNFDPEDWIELYNPSTVPVDLHDWRCMDSEDDHILMIPENTELKSGDYLVICRDTTAFKTYFPQVKHFIGNFDFGFSSGGDCVRLYDEKGMVIDSVTYDDNEPWPTEPDGTGPTLELINPKRENTLPENWAASANHGTPGAKNSVFACDHIPDGDIDTDGKVSILDLVLTIFFLLGKEELTIDQQCMADMNQDGDTTIQDVLMILDRILKPGIR